MGFEILTLDQLLGRLNNYNHVELHVHHTYKPCKADFNGNNGLELQQNMKNYHVNVNGWADIGQHVTLLPNGLFVTGRDFNKIPASILGKNTGAFACEILGNFNKGSEVLGGQQKDSILRLAKYFDDRGKYVRFHRESYSTDCPGTGLDKNVFMSEVKSIGGAKTSVEEIRYTWMDYIKGDIVKDLQRALNSLYSAGLTIDGYLGDLTIGAFRRVLISQGQTNELVRIIQKRLIQLGYMLSKYGADAAYGVGGETYKAIVKFQEDRGLEVDSLIGINTLKELFRN